jgi:hypothetical protein
MPIPKHLRHLYRGPAYRAFVVSLLDRSGNRCEQCKAPNGARVFRVNLRPFAGWWWDEILGIGRDPHGDQWPEFNYWAVEQGFGGRMRGVKIIVGPAHTNNTPGDLDTSHAKAMCQRCHIVFDTRLHVASSRRTRCARKDGERPLFLEASV